MKLKTKEGSWSPEGGFEPPGQTDGEISSLCLKGCCYGDQFCFNEAVGWTG